MKRLAAENVREADNVLYEYGVPEDWCSADSHHSLLANAWENLSDPTDEEHFIWAKDFRKEARRLIEHYRRLWNEENKEWNDDDPEYQRECHLRRWTKKERDEIADAITDIWMDAANG